MLALSGRDRSGGRRHGVPDGPRRSARARRGTSARAAWRTSTTWPSPAPWWPQVSTTACIDPKRVYAIGFSMGGGMAHYLACHAADVFAAVAPSSFDLLEENVGDCQPPRPITVISFRGSADTLVPYEGGPSARGSRHAGHVPRRAGHLPEVGRDRSVHRPAVGAGQQRLLDLRQLPGRRRGGAVHEAGRRPGSRRRRHRLAGAEAASAAVTPRHGMSKKHSWTNFGDRCDCVLIGVMFLAGPSNAPLSVKKGP